MLPNRKFVPNKNNKTEIKQTPIDLFQKEIKEYSQEEINQYNRVYARIEERIKRTNGQELMYCITSEDLIESPPWFFDEYKEPVVLATKYIQDSIAKDKNNNSSIIANSKKDPTNKIYKLQAYSIINSHFTTYAESTDDIVFRALNATKKTIVGILAYNEIVGLSVLEPLFNDFSIREIICNGAFDVQVEIRGKLIRVPGCKFSSTKHLEELIVKIFNSVNKTISNNHPKERARLHDKSRVFAIGTAIAPDGPNLNIRRHTEDWISPIDLLKWESCSQECMEWIGQHIYNGLSGLVVGGTGSGKTTLLNAMMGFIREDARIVTIERNIEMKLPKNKLCAAAMEVVPPNPGADNKEGIPMRELVEASTQMRPDCIVVGETTGEEAYDLLQALNTGHFGYSTIHANSPEDSMYRLMSLTSQSELIKGKAVFDLISAGFDFIVFVERMKEDGSRKVRYVCEVGTEVEKNEKNGNLYLPIYPIWEYKINESSRTTGTITGTWEKVGELSQKRKDKHKLNIAKLPTWEELVELLPKKENTN